MLVPNSTYTVNGVEVREKIIPDGLRWKSSIKALKAGFRKNSLYKKNMLLNGGTGKPLSVTIHNTNDLGKVEDDGEQYTRATYNENMGSARVHFYVDDICAWQNLKAGTGEILNDSEGSAEVSWHAGDGSVADGGNMTSISIEVIMGDTAERDIKAYDNGARLTAWLLWKYGLGINDLLTHTYWVNKLAGKYFADKDEQCTSPVKGKKWCPSYIFGSKDKNVALKNWLEFKALVCNYLNTLNGKTDVAQTVDNNSEETATTQCYLTVNKGDLVKLSKDAVYYGGRKVPEWVRVQNWYVSTVVGDRVVIDKNENGDNAINSPIHVKYLTVVRSNVPDFDAFDPYLVKITAGRLNIRKGAGTHYEAVGMITDRGVYTIVAESLGPGASMWGKLKSGAGWISLDHATPL